MMTRIISALVMAPIAIAAIWFGSPYFDLMIFVVGLAAMFEWYRSDLEYISVFQNYGNALQCIATRHCGCLIIIIDH